MVTKAAGRISRKNEWPCPKFNISEEPHFLFVITPPYSGSTALAQILNSSQGTALLHPRAEGQWLIPGLCQSDRWNPEKRVNWKSVRAVWLQRVQLINELVSNISLIVEKSPPNMVRVDKLTEIFPNHSLAAFNRDPYASCSSILFRNHDPMNKREEERIQIISEIAETWLVRSGWVKKLIEERQVTNFTYEQFCSDPANCVFKIAEEISVLKTVDVSIPIKVKDYEMQGITNMNAEQVSKLSQIEKDTITRVVTKDLDLVSFFGYEILE